MDLEEDSFLNPQTRNLLILDDMMSSAPKDSRINELFTEGSHHRNLSVITINQNLFYNKDPAQRRNCHYMVLFKNPIDKQQVMTLSRQMYPDNPQHLMRHFKEATEKPFAYLLIDLKPTTSESMRMRTDVFTNMSIKEDNPRTTFHLQESPREERTHLSSSYEIRIPTINKNYAKFYSPVDESMASCDDCGLVFESASDLQRHIKRWCPENDNRKRKLPLDDYEESPGKKSRVFQSDDYTMNHEDDSPNTSTEEAYFKRLRQKSITENETTWSEKVEKYQSNGMSQKQAEKKADDKMKETNFTTFLNLYGNTILNILDLEHGEIHGKVMKTIEKFLEKGYENIPAVQMTLRKYKHLLEEMMLETDDEETDDEDDEDDDYDDPESEEEENDE